MSVADMSGLYSSGNTDTSSFLGSLGSGAGSYTPIDTSSNSSITGALSGGYTGLGGSGTTSGGAVWTGNDVPAGGSIDANGNILDQTGNIIGKIGQAIGGIGAGGIMGIAGGMYSMQQANQLGQQAALAADPFAPQRAQYQSMLQGLMTNPSSFSMSPEAQAQLTIGTNNLERSAASQGFLGSGNILGSLQAYGQQVASQDYYKQAALLEALSGATTGSPAAAAGAISNIFGNQQLAMSQLAGGAKAGTQGSAGGVSGGTAGGGSSGSSSGSNIGGTLGTAVGSYFGGPVGGAIGDVLGSAIGGMF